jgi:hypothetical protein
VVASLDIDISHGIPTLGPGTSRRGRELGLTFSPIGGTRLRQIRSVGCQIDIRIRKLRMLDFTLVSASNCWTSTDIRWMSAKSNRNPH